MVNKENENERKKRFIIGREKLEKFKAKKEALLKRAKENAAAAKKKEKLRGAKSNFKMYKRTEYHEKYGNQVPNYSKTLESQKNKIMRLLKEIESNSNSISSSNSTSSQRRKRRENAFAKQIKNSKVSSNENNNYTWAHIKGKSGGF